MLVIEASPDSLEEALGALRLEYVGKGEGMLEDDDLVLSEVVVQESSRLAGRSAMSLRLLYRYRVALVGVSRQGQRFREKVRKLELRPGDVLLLLGAEERLADVTGRLGLLPLADRGQRVIQRDKAWLAVGIFAAAIADCQPRAGLPADRAWLRCGGVCVPQHRAHSRGLQIHRMAGHRIAGVDDSDRRGIAVDRRYGADRRWHRRSVCRLFAGRRADAC